MEPEGSLPCSQEPSTGPYPEPDQFIPSYPYLSISILILSTHLRLGLPSGLIPSGFSADIFAPFVLHALPISSSLTWSFLLYLEKSTSYEAPHYAVFSKLLSLHSLLAFKIYLSYVKYIKSKLVLNFKDRVFMTPLHVHCHLHRRGMVGAVTLWQIGPPLSWGGVESASRRERKRP
jgi:hypothetical protein